MSEWFDDACRMLASPLPRRQLLKRAVDTLWGWQLARFLPISGGLFVSSCAPVVNDNPPQVVTANGCKIKKIGIWLNGFIPKDMSSDTVPVPGQPEKTMFEYPRRTNYC